MTIFIWHLPPGLPAPEYSTPSIVGQRAVMLPWNPIKREQRPLRGRCPQLYILWPEPWLRSHGSRVVRCPVGAPQVADQHSRALVGRVDDPAIADVDGCV